MRGILRGFTGLLPLLLIAVTGCRSDIPETEDALLSPKAYSEAAALAQTIEILREYYVDSGQVTTEKLLAAALRGMVEELDRYSGYEPPADYRNNEGERTGEQFGIGVEATKTKGEPMRLLRVVAGGPAAKAGLKAGDEIQSIDDKDLRPLSLEECMTLIRGSEGSSLRVASSTPGTSALVPRTVTRARVAFPSVPPEAAVVMEGGIGYLRIESFNQRTPEEFRRAIALLTKNGMKNGLVIDLRNNPGGMVQPTLEIASMFLKPGEVILRAVNRKDKKETPLTAGTGMKIDTQLPVILLVNGNTASCGELFSAALRDHNRARLVGTQTWGKGTLLRVLPLPDGGALRFSTGRYVSPKGQVIEGKGLTPDLKSSVPPNEVHALLIQGRRHPGVVQPAEANTLRDTQLADAIRLLNAPKPEK